MSRVLLMLLVACGGEQKPSTPSADATWIEGRFHSAQRDSYWQTVSGVQWGVALDDAGFEVSYVDGTPRTLVSLVNGANPVSFVQKSTVGGVDSSVSVTRHRTGFVGEDQGVKFEVVRNELRTVPEIEQADLDFAADTAKDGADGWERHFDEHGAMWQAGHRIEGDAIKATMTKTLAAGALTWRPVTSGARGDLGFSLGTAEFTEPGGKPERMTYCTIWLHEADGSWKVLFDIGRPAV